MNKAVKFLKECRTFYLATTEGDQPRVRPFGAVAEIDGKVYITTNNTKPVFRQIIKNPKIEICGFNPDGNWIRISARAVPDPEREVKVRMLAENPGLGSMYSPDDGIFEVLRLENAGAVISSFEGVRESFAF